MGGLIGKIYSPKEIHGKSAYQVALANGFEGTEKQWLESLKEPALNAAESCLKEESIRQANEERRITAENERIVNEQMRIQNENTRKNAENERISNETLRENAEKERGSRFNTWKTAIGSLSSYDSRITRNDKRITNLEKGLPDDSFVTDSSVAYMKDVPENALPYAEVTKIGGMSYKCTNLLNFEYWAQNIPLVGGEKNVDSNGITITAISNDCYTSFDTSTDIAKITVQPNHTYVLNWEYSGTSDGNVFVFMNGNAGNNKNTSVSNKTLTFTSPEDCKFITFRVGVTGAGNSLTYHEIWINEGEALPYEPYFEGLHSAPATEVKSVGMNLIPYPYLSGNQTVHGVTIIANDDGGIFVNGTATSAVFFNLNEFRLNAGTYTLSVIANFAISTELIQVYAVVNGAYYWGNSLFTISEPANVDLKLRIMVGGGATNGLLYAMLNKGTEALPYSPYMESTLPIPEAVQALDGYGEGINENCYNSIEWAEDGKRTWNKRCAKYDMANLPWGVNAAKTAWFAVLPVKSKNLFITNYSGQYELYFSGDLNAFVVQEGFATLEELQAHFNGVFAIIAYETPMITDISDLIPDDNFIEVEGNGSITAVNEYGYAVPTEITYQIKEATE